MRSRADDFDIIHFHLSHFLHFPFFEHMPGRTVTTPHGRLDYSDLAGAYSRWPRFPMISISHRQRLPLNSANWVGNIHHGLPPQLYQPVARDNEDGRAYLAFLGRLSRDKRPDRAIEIARQSGLKLRIAAKVGEDDRAYFHDTIEPLIDGVDIEYVGEIGEAEKEAFLGNAAALLFPIDWPEPFGLVVIEAMACGTPVIAWDSGAMAEIVDEGVTGFIVRSISEAVDAVKRVPELDRELVRLVFERALFGRPHGSTNTPPSMRGSQTQRPVHAWSDRWPEPDGVSTGTGAAWRCSTNANSIRPSRWRRSTTCRRATRTGNLR